MSLSADLEKWFSQARKVVVVGVGNPLRRDDNIGVTIVSELERTGLQSVLLIKSETVPESFIASIVEFHPSHILIIDAALIHRSPGSATLVTSLPSPATTISTHALPIQIFCEYLEKATHAKIAMLLIQPEDISFGEGLTPNLHSAKERIVRFLVEILGSTKD